MTDKDRLVRDCRNHIENCDTCLQVRTTELLCAVGHGLWLASMQPPTFDLCGADECGAPQYDQAAPDKLRQHLASDDRLVWDESALDRLWDAIIKEHRPDLANFVVVEDMWRLNARQPPL